MKTINKSGSDSSDDTFYVLLYEVDGDYWEGGSFCCNDALKYATEEVAISHANPDMVVAKVTLVAKIV